MAQKSLEEVKGMHLSTWRRPATSAPAALGVQRTLRVMLAAQRRGNDREYIVCVTKSRTQFFGTQLAENTGTRRRRQHWHSVETLN